MSAMSVRCLALLTAIAAGGHAFGTPGGGGYLSAGICGLMCALYVISTTTEAKS